MWKLVYVGPPDHIRAEQGTNYIYKEMHINLDVYGVVLEEASIENTGTIGMAERYKDPLKAEF